MTFFLSEVTSRNAPGDRYFQIHNADHDIDDDRVGVGVAVAQIEQAPRQQRRSVGLPDTNRPDSDAADIDAAEREAMIRALFGEMDATVPNERGPEDEAAEAESRRNWPN